VEFFYRCTECDRQFEIGPDLMVCPDCAKRQVADRPLRGVLEVGFTGTRTSNWPASGTYGELLPIEERFFPPVPVGNTPLWQPTNLREKLGLARLFLKDETANPTESLKDRASALVAACANKYGITDVVVASTGNAASSMAGIGAAAGLNVKIFVPKTAPRAKLIQSLQYGADVTLVDGPYDDAVTQSLEFTRSNKGLNRNTGYNPMTIEGKKTAALEIFAQLGRIPDVVYVPTGDGVILGGIYKGFEDIVALGLADHMPAVVAVQAEGSNAICRALKLDGFTEPVNGDTIADSISVGVPANGQSAVAKLRKHRGRCVEVSDVEILDAQIELSSVSGLFAEPAAAAALAGLRKELDRVPPESTIVLLITGSGLKDIDAAGRRVRVP